MAVVRVKGLNETLSALRKLGDDMEDLKTANQKLGTEIAAEAAAIAPKLSGALASSIRANRAKKRVTIKAGNTRVPYAGVIEYGWPRRGIEAQSYLRKAAFDNKDLISRRYEDNIKEVIKKWDFDRD